MCGLILTLGDRNMGFFAGLNKMSHRGLYERSNRHGAWGLGHVRLPIVGLDPRFDSPYRHEGWTFLFVGEIVNYKGLMPNASCDVEVLARSWVAEGPGCLRKFDGFWAVVAIPPDGRSAMVATDFLAKKPLYYRTDMTAVASEIKALVELGPVDPDPAYFSSVRKNGYHAGDRTWARQVRKLPAGCLWTISNLGETTGYEPRFDAVEPDPNIHIEKALVVSVARRVLSSDVPVAMLHSGGLDSSLVYAMAKGLRDDLKVYNVPGDGVDFSRLGITDEVVGVTYDTIDVETALRVNEGPVDLGSMLPQLAMALSVNERVAISGDGADELFGGYKRSLQYDSQGSDVFEELVYYHLPRLDKMMMAGTVELRSPFLGRDVVAGALALPWESRRKKCWLRNMARNYLPWAFCQQEKLPLKSRQVVKDPIAWRMELCDTFETMIKEGRAT